MVAAQTLQLTGRWAGGLDPPRHPDGRLGGLIVLMLLASCQKPPIGETDAPGLEAPPYVTLAEAHNARIDRLGTIYARGVIELRWSDDDGKHIEQGDLDLWIALPHQTALNISKFGERLMWLGSDDRQSWLFDFRGDETVLYRSTGDQRSDDRADAQLPIDPAALLRLSGLIRLPPEEPQGPAPVGYNAQLDAWVVMIPLPSEVLRLHLDRATLLPVRVEALSPDGRVRLYSRLRLDRYESVAMVGVGPGQRPKFPTLIDIFNADDTAAVKVAARSPTDQVKDRFFDLDWLMSVFVPDRIEGRATGESQPAVP